MANETQLPPVCAEWNTDASLYVAALDKAIKAARTFAGGTR